MRLDRLKVERSRVSASQRPFRRMNEGCSAAVFDLVRENDEA
jgi:hypothetical protein